MIPIMQVTTPVNPLSAGTVLRPQNLTSIDRRQALTPKDALRTERYTKSKMVSDNIGIQIKRKELTIIFMMISNRKKWYLGFL